MKSMRKGSDLIDFCRSRDLFSAFAVCDENGNSLAGNVLEVDLGSSIVFVTNNHGWA